MAADLKKDFGIQAQMEPGKAGVFDVHVDGKLVFSKHQIGRFPDAGEVSKLIRGLQSNQKKA